MSIDDDTQGDLLDARDDARLASTIGLLSTALSLIAPCMCYLTCIPALALGIYAISKGRTARLDFPDDDAVSGLADVATALGLMSIIHAALWISIIAMYVLLYVAIIFIAVMLG